jgi:hypothetical protein
MTRTHPTALASSSHITRHAVSLLATCASLLLACGAGQGAAGRTGPCPEAPATRIDAGLDAACACAGAGPGDARVRDGAPAAGDAGIPVLARGVMRGAFVEIQEGDYFHIIIRDPHGRLESFFIAPELPARTWEPFLTDRHRGKTVEVTWDEVFVYLPETGTDEVIRRATDIKLVE